MAYATAGDISNHLGRALTSQETTLAPTLITAAQDYIDRRCGRTFELTAGNTNLTKYYDTGYFVDDYVDPFNLSMTNEPSGNRMLAIDDCLSLTSTAVDSNGNHAISLLNEQRDVSGTLYQGPDFRPYPLDYVERGIGFSAIYRIGTGWSAGHGTISIQGNWAYTTSAPAGVNIATSLIVAYYIRNKQKIISESIEGYSVNYFRQTVNANEETNQYLADIVDQYCPKRVRVYA